MGLLAQPSPACTTDEAENTEQDEAGAHGVHLLRSHGDDDAPVEGVDGRLVEASHVLHWVGVGPGLHVEESSGQPLREDVHRQGVPDRTTDRVRAGGCHENA